MLSMQLTMILIKVADISNEVRPMEVSEPWAERLLQEFFMQVCATSARDRVSLDAFSLLASVAV